MIRPITVWLAISSYRNDEDVVRIVQQVLSHGQKIFGRILVVDSEGTGTLPKVICGRGWDSVEYRCYDQNLGSGGNLRERLRLAAEGDADYVYALNHDGHFEADTFHKLLNVAESIADLGAAYPLAYLSNAHSYNVTGTRELPLPAKLVARPPSGPLIEVFWSSSNGALYSLEPVRQGVLPWGAMWMAWEDLEYGWRLSTHGYRQVIVCDAVYPDNYEYKNTWLGRIVDKPAWRTYYNSRNLTLAVRRSRNRPVFHAAVFYRLLRELALILLARGCKCERITGLFMGALHGWTSTIGADTGAQNQAGMCSPSAQVAEK